MSPITRDMERFLMATYLVSYDLNRPGQDYEPLIKAIKEKFSTWWHHLDSTWVIVTSYTAVQVRDILSSYLDKNDELIVAKLSGEAAWQGFNDKGSSWLKNNL
jgi:hypothetical protein